MNEIIALQKQWFHYNGKLIFSSIDNRGTLRGLFHTNPRLGLQVKSKYWLTCNGVHLI